MKEYDFVFSLGFCCSCSEALRAEHLQFTSCPFDWLGVTDVLQAPRAIACDFRDWLNREDLDLWDVRITGGFVTRVYRNRKTGFGFVHEFSNAAGIDQVYPEVKAKFDRRIARFIHAMSSAHRVLAVYLEVSKNPRAPDADLVEARRLLASRYPQTEIDLLYIYEDPNARSWSEVSALENGAIHVVAADYRTYLNGEITHLCTNEQIRACVRSYAQVVDRRTDAEKAQFSQFKRNEVKEALGKTWLQRKINKKLRQLFRDVESYLEAQHIMPGDRPLWFDGDGK